MAKLYRVQITAIDTDTNETNVETDETFRGLTLIGSCADGEHMNEIVLHENIVGMASKLAQGEHTSIAVKLAALLMEAKAHKAESAEEALIRSILEGIDNE